MTPETKTKAIEKLKKLGKGKIGYPEKWRDYSSVSITRDDFLGNSRRADRFEVKRNYDKLGKPVDKTEWSMTPPTVNAYYSSQFAEIVFPAGILQPPFFDVKVDDAVNFGAIGAVIGHELSHGFDDSGPQVRRRWQPEGLVDGRGRKSLRGARRVHRRPVHGLLSRERSEDREARVPERQAHARREHRRQRRRPHRVHGIDEHPRGSRPHRRRRLHARAAFLPRLRAGVVPELDRRRTPCSASSPTRIRPAAFRTNGTVSNMPEFQEAFSCKAGAPMAPEKRCRVW